MEEELRELERVLYKGTQLRGNSEKKTILFFPYHCYEMQMSGKHTAARACVCVCVCVRERYVLKGINYPRGL